MQAHYDASFSREHGITQADWLHLLPRAVHGHAMALAGGEADIQLGAGHLRLAWRALPMRQIALVRLPRLAVDYRFDGVDEATRQSFMKRFDLTIQRGGG
jgi:hypothetical protein